MLDYKLLDALARVTEEGSFVRASNVLCLTQSAVSQRIRSLEEACGQVLLTRSTPPQPTSAGRRLLKHYRQVRLLEEGLHETDDDQPITLSVGVNADSLACWFADALRPLFEEGLFFDLRVDDQERTHDLLRNGDVIGCVSTASDPIKGCRATHLGSVTYRLLATPRFIQIWFPDGFSMEEAERAPTALYDRNDRIQHDYFSAVFGVRAPRFAAHYIPSPEQVYRVIAAGHAYGLVPESQSAKQLASGDLIDLHPDRPHEIDLYWHRWNIDSGPLRRLTERLTSVAGDGFSPATSLDL